MAKPIQPDRPIWPQLPDTPGDVDPGFDDQSPSNEPAQGLPQADRISADPAEGNEPVRLR
ncbi:hypothetical protein MBUL_04377 [Methylobacterium bullatum]|uniref:Uncharacterized protein n=1 Tax=Methylobacterium bullatum TaxID=570505 RepID=A0A679JCQ5_9HYPH|nr:hypothetical protein MBUL_04377 [Methylobacterium bullatum]